MRLHEPYTFPPLKLGMFRYLGISGHPSLTLTGSRRALDDGVPATLVILAFLSPPAPEDAAEPALGKPAAAAFLFFSRIILARLSVSVGAGSGVSSRCVARPDPAVLLLAEEGLPTAPSPTAEKVFALVELGGEVLGKGGLGDRLLLFDCCSLWALDAAVVAGDAVVVLLYRVKTLSRYSSSAVSTSTAGSSSTCCCVHVGYKRCWCDERAVLYCNSLVSNCALFTLRAKNSFSVHHLPHIHHTPAEATAVYCYGFIE